VRVCSRFVNSSQKLVGDCEEGRAGARNKERRERVLTVAMLIHAGSKSLGSSEPPERYRTQEVT